MIKNDPIKRLIPFETLIAPLSFGGGGGEVVFEVEGVVDGVVVGLSFGVDGEGVPLPLGEVLAATTLTSSFMPPVLVQCPGVGHMKYILPVLLNGTLEFPSSYFFIVLLESQPLYPLSSTSFT